MDTCSEASNAQPSCNVMLRTVAPEPAVRKVDSYGVVTSSYRSRSPGS